MPRSAVALLCLATLVVPLTAQDQIRWTRSAAPDGSFSLEQPDGWAAKFGRSNLRLSNAPRDEEIVVIRLPRDAAKSPADYAGAVVRSFQQSLASFQMSNFQSQGDSAAFLVTYKSGGKDYLGPGAVAVKQAAAWWVSYGSPSAANLQRGATLIAGVARSVADGATSASQPSLAPATPQQPQSSALVGTWNTGSYYGELVNSSGVAVQSSYSGERYEFAADGTYRYTHAASGRIITGVVICLGTYDARGDTVQLHQKTESWYPMPHSTNQKAPFRDKPTPQEITLQIERRGPGEIVIHEGTSATTFRRDPNSK
jgi:hypothetical protein